MKQTPLYSRQKALGAKMTEFGEWELPLTYGGSTIAEWQATRYHAALFDVSHMGCIEIRGPQTIPFLNYLSTQSLLHRKEGSAVYTPFCRSNGTTVDDVLIYILSQEQAWIVVNASNREKDLEHLLSYQTAFQVSIRPHYEEYGILALQGPLSTSIMQTLFPDFSPPNSRTFIVYPLQDCDCLLIARTGYTGSDGYELIGNEKVILDFWDKCISLPKVAPAGLAARDILRLEMGYALYGHELSDSIAPTESVAAWAVALKKDSFIGKEALSQLEKNPDKRSACGLLLLGGSLGREGDPIFLEDAKVGYVTSGGYSPALKKGIALGLTQNKLEIGQKVFVEVRGKKIEALVHKLPFCDPKKL